MHIYASALYNLTIVASACSMVYVPCGANSVEETPVIIPFSFTHSTYTLAHSETLCTCIFQPLL